MQLFNKTPHKFLLLIQSIAIHVGTLLLQFSNAHALSAGHPCSREFLTQLCSLLHYNMQESKPPAGCAGNSPEVPVTGGPYLPPPHVPLAYGQHLPQCDAPTHRRAVTNSLHPDADHLSHNNRKSQPFNIVKNKVTLGLSRLSNYRPSDSRLHAAILWNFNSAN